MKPILFAKNETNFTTNGLGRLDCISCEVVEERNGMYELEAEIPITGAHANEIEMHSIIGVVPHEGSNIQAFYVYKIGKPISGRFRVYGRHISYRLTDIPCMPFSIAASPQAAAQTLEGLKNNAIEACPFNFTTDVTTGNPYIQKTPASIRQRLGGVEGSVIDQFGGEFEWDNWNVRLLKARGRLANVTGISLRYGKNITDLDQEEEIASTVTGVVPFWVDTDGNNLVTLPEHAVYAPTAGSYPYHLTQVLDLSSEFQDKPTVAQLRNTATLYVNKSGFGVPKVSIKVSFVDLWKSEEYKDIAPLEQVKLCDEITVDFEKLGIKALAKVVKTDYDVLKERYNSIEVGSIRTTLAQAVTDRDKDIDTAFVNELTRVNTAISNATAWLTSANGYVVAVKNNDGSWKELFLMNTNDPQTATQGIRFNNNGLGFFNKALHPGGNILSGPYDMAWTIDGRLGDFVNKNFWNFITGEFSLSAGTTVGGKTVDAIAQDKADAAQAAAENTAAQALAAQVAIYDEDIADLQDQIDGNITTWYYSGTPTLNNPPASTWTTTTDKDNHIGDIYYDSATGYAYRFMKDGSTYLWTKISDSDIEAALAEAQDAWDLADNKRRVFISQPVPPYDIGDMWVQGSNGDIKRCATAKTSSQTYSASDWVLASKYTDDTAVTNLDHRLTQQNVFDRLTDNGRTMGIYLTPDPTDPTKKLLMINANYIATGILASQNLQDNPQSVYTVVGTKLDTANGVIKTPKFGIDANGNVFIASGATIGGYAHTSDIPDVSGYATKNGLAQQGYTVINGSNITTGTIKSANYEESLDTRYSDGGTQIDLINGNIRTYDFAVDNSASSPAIYANRLIMRGRTNVSPIIDFEGFHSVNEPLHSYIDEQKIRLQGFTTGVEQPYIDIGAGSSPQIIIDNDSNSKINIQPDDIYKTTGIFSPTTVSVRWNSPSDKRVKENIKILDMELSVSLIDETEPMSFSFIGDKGKHYGMIAQDVREVLNKLGEKDAVLEKSMGIPDEMSKGYDMRMLYYEEYIPHLINYVKDLRETVNRQQAEIDELKEIVKRLSV